MNCEKCGVRLLQRQSIEAGRCDLCRYGWPLPEDDREGEDEGRG